MGNSGSSDSGGSDSDKSNVSYVGTVSVDDSYHQEVTYMDGTRCTTFGDASSNISVSETTNTDGSKTTSVDVGDVTVASVNHYSETSRLFSD